MKKAIFLLIILTLFASGVALAESTDSGPDDTATESNDSEADAPVTVCVTSKEVVVGSREVASRKLWTVCDVKTCTDSNKASTTTKSNCKMMSELPK